MKRYNLLLKGKVQGVGFRYFCQYQATLKNITGTIRNLDNGDVELEAQGNEKDLEKFIQIVLKGNGFSKVIDYDLSPISIIDNEKKFKITA